jgi:SpoVK/Ycf46/Vps4 family AAA+-type ATPase
MWQSVCVQSADLATRDSRPLQVSWHDVGGNADIKQQLKEAVQWPFQSQQALSRLGAVAPKGEGSVVNI